MEIAGRSMGKITGALTKRQHYIAAANLIMKCERPGSFLGRYLFGKGNYPICTTLKIPGGHLSVTLWSRDDLFTVNEIFFRLDYPATPKDKIFVDFGSNIGISAAYFLSRQKESFAYLFEPLPQNTTRLYQNLSHFEGRFFLNPVAVGLENGKVDFGWEETGRYGGVGQNTGNYISVECRDSNEILQEIIDRHGLIDILKVDIETLESQVTQRIPDSLASKIRKIYVEYNFLKNPLERTHRLVQYGSVSQFFNKNLC